MTQQFVSDFPPIEAAYTDEFGAIDPQVYQTAKEIWAPAKRFAARYLSDPDEAGRLMLKAVARVSRALAENDSDIRNPRAYLYRTFKRLVLSDIEKESNRREKLDGWLRDRERGEKDEEAEINRKILLNELRRRMDEWTREVFDLLSMDYKYEELVPDYGTAANVIRSKFSKRLAGLARAIQAEMKSVDDEIV
jgi:DNA-directed RNA polymerase specialized sigma24 family protein